MLSNIVYQSPYYIEEDTNVTIQVKTVKNGVESDPTEFTLVAKAQAPIAPTYDEALSGEPGSYLEFEVNTEPNTKIVVSEITNATATVNGSKIKVNFPDQNTDYDVNLKIKATRGKFSSGETEFNINVVIPIPTAPVVSGSYLVNEKETLTFIVSVESDCTLEASALKGTCAISGKNVIYTAPEVSADDTDTITFTSKRKSKVTSVTKEIQITNVKEKSASLELADSQALKVLKGSNLVINFKSVEGTLAVTNNSEYYGAAVVEGNTIKISGTENGTMNISVTQTETDKLPSDALDIQIKVYEVSSTLIASTSNESSVEVNKSIDINFDNANGTLSIENATDNITTLIQDNKVVVNGVSEGSASFDVYQTETDKEISEKLTISITVTAAAAGDDESEDS